MKLKWPPKRRKRPPQSQPRPAPSQRKRREASGGIEGKGSSGGIEGKERHPLCPPTPPPPLGVVYGERGYPAVLLFPLGEREVVEVIVGSDSWNGYRFYLEGNKVVVARSARSGEGSFHLASLPKGGYAWLPVKPKGGGR